MRGYLIKTENRIPRTNRVECGTRQNTGDRRQGKDKKLATEPTEDTEKKLLTGSRDIFRLGRLFEPSVAAAKNHTTKRTSITVFYCYNPALLASRNKEVKEKND